MNSRKKTKEYPVIKPLPEVMPLPVSPEITEPKENPPNVPIPEIKPLQEPGIKPEKYGSF